MKLQAFAPSAARKILVYGPPKTGKTELVAALAKKYRLWWFDFEDGIKSVFSSPRIEKAWLENIEYFHIPDTQIFPIGIETVLKVIKGAETWICHQHGAANCLTCKQKNGGAFTDSMFSRICLSEFTNNDILVFDSGSQLSASAMNHIQKALIAADKFDVKPDWDDYFKQGRILDRVFSIVQQSPFNFVCITHENLVEMEDGKKKLVPIAGTSQFSKTFAKYFDDVVYTDIVNKKHKAASSTTYSGNIVLGSRTGKELEKLETPSLLPLFE